MRNEEWERGGNRDGDKDRNRTRGRKCVYNITFINYGMGMGTEGTQGQGGGHCQGLLILREGRGVPACVSLKCVWRRFPSGEEEVLGAKQTLFLIPRGHARL